jgi:pyruvate ferredoxin oxidoreductase gamma subunit
MGWYYNKSLALYDLGGHMFQVRIHGRGGQGVVTAAEMLSIAAFLEKKYSQAFPSFGSERMGAPVTAFCRISDVEIRSREPILEPNAVIIQDRTVIEPSNAFQGIVENGFVLINSSSETIGDLPDVDVKLKCIDATGIALEYVGRPIPNAVLLGSFAALTEIISISSVIEAIKTKFSGTIAEKNINAARAAYEKTL